MTEDSLSRTIMHHVAVGACIGAYLIVMLILIGGIVAVTG